MIIAFKKNLSRSEFICKTQSSFLKESFMTVKKLKNNNTEAIVSVWIVSIIKNAYYSKY